MNTQSNSAQNSEQTNTQANSFKINTQRRMSLDDIIKQQDQDRGLKPLPLESELLLKRVKDGGHSGQFLADAFISAYRTDTPFPHSLGGLNRLDAERALGCSIKSFTSAIYPAGMMTTFTRSNNRLKLLLEVQNEHFKHPKIQPRL